MARSLSFHLPLVERDGAADDHRIEKMVNRREDCHRPWTASVRNECAGRRAPVRLLIVGRAGILSLRPAGQPTGRGGRNRAVGKMAEIVNLRRARKRKRRAEAEAGAAENRTRFGRPKAEKRRQAAQRDKADKALDGKKLD
ncbi:MAG: DUF4169 family protein [Kiloniellaceae bacterium]